MNVRIALAQINTTVGDISGNVEKINKFVDKAIEQKADIVIFPELTMTGYPPEDLLLLPAFVAENREYLKKIKKTKDLIIAVGFVDSDNGFLYNAVAVIFDGRIAGKYYKHLLPNYGVFDEKRYFEKGKRIPIFRTHNFCFGLNICEDIWYQSGTSRALKDAGAQFIINISSSPYHLRKFMERYDVLMSRYNEIHIPIAYVNLVGAQDELVFDGNSTVINGDGKIIAKAKEFEEDLVTADISAVAGEPDNYKNCINIDYRLKQTEPLPKGIADKTKSDEEEIYGALVCGLRDYFNKNKFKKAIIGLSGGIDSALTLAITSDAIGSKKIIAVSMPSVFSSLDTKSDAKKIAHNFQTEFFEIPIQTLFDRYLSILQPVLHLNAGVTTENIQARIRGNLLMAMSNKFMGLVIATGNKSELSMGYCTLYGDMVGGFAVLKDVYKTFVYKLSDYRNKRAGYDIIPQSIIDRDPSAELRENQKDTDTLPPYTLLDEVLSCYIEKNYNIDELSARGFDKSLIRQIIETVDKNEYKRRQGPPGIKITKRAFGKDRRMPIVNKYIRK